MTHKNFQAMRRDIDAAILSGEGRHFLDFHFANHNEFAQEFVELMCVLEDLCPGAGSTTVKKISSLRGSDRATYEQIVQALCELIIGKKFIEAFPESEGFKLDWEPTDVGKANPEFMLVGPKWRLLVEVKCPSLHDYETKNGLAAQQLTARLPGLKDVMTEFSGVAPALPLDNKLKDFLVSAEKKFSSFQEVSVPTYGLLVVCWTERMFEAVSPLSNEGCGLLTSESYYRKDEEVVKFTHVSGVITTQQQSFLKSSLAGHRPNHLVSDLDYGSYWKPNTPANPIYSPNEFAKRQLPQEIIDVLEAVMVGHHLDPIASPIDFVMWLQ
ncbi:hypothetical protein [Pseudomonas azotoformans]|uniref:hypothetical protein n=1 Tax=Pseudomonas azotoformans TaxID=47878 RepID=UPI00122DE855|nr:hypothetical protein [Pseudomonas azotoformans]UMY49304.1 hypothetical protein MLC69_29170 [Pseudomonas azotoformans]